MNAENFAEIIKNPSQLYQVSYQELKTLALQYPYCGNLYYLLLIKSHMDQHREFEQVLEKTAARSIDRRRLYQQVRSLDPGELLSEHFELGEEFLELHDLSTLESPPTEAISLERPSSLSGEETEGATNGDIGSDFPAPPPRSLDDADDSIPLEFDLSLPEKETGGPEQESEPPLRKEISRTPHFRPPEEIVQVLGTCTAIVEDWPVAADHRAKPAPQTAAQRPTPPNSGPTTPATGRPSPQPKRAFSSWTSRYQAAHQPHPGLQTSEPPAKKKEKRKNPIVAFADRSLKENENVVSETLAGLLANQERYDKAIQMYERLILIFPEKSSFFAEKIAELKKRL